MPDLLLQQRYSASSVEDASAGLRAALGVGRITGGGGAFDYRQRSLVDDGVSVTRIISTGVSVVAQEISSPDLVAVLLREGRLTIARGSDSATLDAGDIGLIPLGEQVELRWDQVTVDLFSFPQASVRRILGALDGSVRLHAPRLTPRSRKVQALWTRLAALLAGQVLEDPDLYERDQIREQIIDALFAATIEAFDLSNAAEDDPASDAGLVGRAQTYMKAHMGEPISIPDVARAAAVSVRGLQMAFQRELTSSPLLHLRELRMTRARTLLGSARQGATTVSGVARGLGYSNLGRFSAHYRSAFGESPSTTLRAATAHTDQPSAE